MRHGSTASIRQWLGWALVGALTVAALTAIGALLGGSFGETEGRVLGTSLGFALFSATGASGASARLRSPGLLELIGVATAAASVAAFAFLVGAVWLDDGAEGLWRGFGCAGILAVAGSHACLVLGARRSDDSETIGAMVAVSLLAAGIDATAGIVAVSGLADDVGDGTAQLIAICLVVLVLTTVLPPILRRLAPASETAAPTPLRPAGEMLAIADRIDELGRDPGLRAPEIRRETDRLRRLARQFPV